MRAPFLTAEWRGLAMLNYEIDPAVLQPFVPAGTELDSFGGKTYASMVGFHFRRTRVRGVPIPFHINFEEVNLRFYVRREVAGETRRGVVFVKELVPRHAIAWLARWFYNENYIAVPMSHRNNKYGLDRRVTYGWRFAGRENSIDLRVDTVPFLPREDSLEAFITEHYWGYVRQRDGSTVEYQVEHPRWRVWTALEGRLPATSGRFTAKHSRRSSASRRLRRFWRRDQRSRCIPARGFRPTPLCRWRRREVEESHAGKSPADGDCRRKSRTLIRVPVGR